MNTILFEALEKNQWYEAARLLETDGWAGDPPPEAHEGLLMMLAGLGRLPTIVDYCLSDPNFLQRSPNTIATGLWAFLQAGRGTEILPVLNNQDQLLEEPALAPAIALCLQQAGLAKNAAGVLAKLARHSAFDPRLGRQAVWAIVRSTGAVDHQALEAGLASALPSIPNAVWLKYELLRHGVPDDDPAAFPSADAQTVDTAKQSFNPIVTGIERVHAVRAGSGPNGEGPNGTGPNEAGRGARLPATLDQAVLDASVQRLAADLQSLARDPWVAKQMAFLDAIRAEFAPRAGDPIQVISTGRVGTTALFDLLAQTDAYAPYHSFSWQTLPKHRVHALNLLYSDAPLATHGRDLFRDYFACRFPELVRAYRQNRVPVLVSHWDVIFAPFLKALFPRLSFLFMRRDPRKVVHSLIGKRQYGYTQLLDIPFEANADSKDAVLRLPPIDEMPRDVAWYMAFTERFWTGLVALNGGERISEVSSDALFAGRPTAIEDLRVVLPNIGRTDAEIAEHFSVPINEKTERQLQLAERQSSWIEACVHHFEDFLSA